jgi:ATP-dependent exoDNAse (exonuclease V) beta subunit
LHFFARRTLADYPIQAGLPPLVEVMDEVASGIAFERRWTATRVALLDDPDASVALRLALAAGMQLDDLRSIARAFNDNWDLIEDRVLGAPSEHLPALDVTALADAAGELVARREQCASDTDKFLTRLNALAEWMGRLSTAPDDPARLSILHEARNLKWSWGLSANWPIGLAELRSECQRYTNSVTQLRDRILDAALRRLARHLAQATLLAAEDRRASGRLEFHDLLVLARDLLRHPNHGAAVRAGLQSAYPRLFLDEFQDTDPIQIELAVRLAGGAEADAPDWIAVDIPAASIFLVGDPKQSIYRFRRADIATYLLAQRRIGVQLTLDTNFRTCAPILDWINHVFGRLIIADGLSQPAYVPMRAKRAAAPGGPAVVALGTELHMDAPTAIELRVRETADIAAAVRSALAARWQVQSDDEQTDGGNEAGWRDVRLGDITILIPARTCLPQLEEALDAAGIAYQSEASSLVYRSREVRDLLLAARATDDPSDPLALVATLRSPMFGCGDDDLWIWHRAGGRWNVLAPHPAGLSPDHPVAKAMAYLRHLHNDRTWLAPSEVLARLVNDRRMLEVACEGSRPRDVWRRLRFIVDQARAWTDAEHGSLRGYLGWASRQASEGARAGEAVLPEIDTDAVRIMTIHAAKGLEFPVVIVAGMSGRPGGVRGGVQLIWPRRGGYQLRVRKDVQTGEFDLAQPIEEQMDHHERLRLLYVACTRARDHLVVSLHRRTRAERQVLDQNLTNSELLARACVDAPPMERLAGEMETPVPDSGTSRAAPPPVPFEQWFAMTTAARARAAHSWAVGASQLEGAPGMGAAPPPIEARPPHTDRLGEPLDPGLAKAARDLELPPWNKGRYGTAIGRAVHGVLQSVDLATGRGLDDAVAAQALAEGVVDHADVVRELAQAALGADIVQRAAARPHWRETYAGTEIGDRVLEGYVDLLYRDDDGLVIVDYKTDAVPTGALDARAAFYRPQLAAYATMIAAATAEPVARCLLLFLSPQGAVERRVDVSDETTRQIRELVRAGLTGT